MEYNFGTLDLGTYFFRPARVKHGHFTTMEGGATWLLRSDGELLNWYTQNEWVRWGGEAVNYGPDGAPDALVAVDRTTWAPARPGAASADLARPGQTPRQWQQRPGQHRPRLRPARPGHRPLPGRHRQGPRRRQPAGRPRRRRARPRPRTTTPTTTSHGEHGHVHDGEVDPASCRPSTGAASRGSLEHPDERTDGTPTTGAPAACGREGDPYPRADHLVAARAQPLPRPLGRRRHVTPPPYTLPGLRWREMTRHLPPPQAGPSERKGPHGAVGQDGPPDLG